AGEFVQAVRGVRGDRADTGSLQSGKLPVFGGLGAALQAMGRVSSSLRRDLRPVRPAGFEPATKGFKGPRVSTRLGLSHPPRRSRSRASQPSLPLESGCDSRGGRALAAGIIVGAHPASL